MINQLLTPIYQELTVAEIWLIQGEQKCRIVFNKYGSLYSYRKFLFELETRSVNMFLEKKEELSTYIPILQNYLVEIKALFPIVDNFYCHANKKVLNINKQRIQWDMLSQCAQKKASKYIYEQFKMVLRLEKHLLKYMSDLDSAASMNQFIWKGSKTEFVELANAIFEGKLIGSTIKISKNQFMNELALTFGLKKLGNFNITLNKIMLRESQNIFLEKLINENQQYFNNKL
ncbi:MAG: hypothetical protein ACPKPY_05850 [Nitrososphaeraceae archaeon]